MYPTILLSNDDGIYATGIKTLAKAFIKRGWAVTIIAPRAQRSGEGKAITFDQPIRIEEVPLSYLNEEKGWRITGTPADAVIHGVYQRASSNKPPYDLIISGINSGENTSVHSILTSGTCAVSFEAALLGYPSVAFSIDVDEQQFFNESATPPGLEIAAEIASDITYKIFKNGLPEGIAFLNVNFPENVTENTPIEICQMAMTKYRDYTIRREDPRGVPYYWIWGDTLDLPKNTDSYAVLKRKIISITPITLFLDGREQPNIKTKLDFLRRSN